ncbi:MAG: patatin family protein [Lachnospiraceae bacterium]|nr:patatin family protein [Lachnospiraceae bacterium]
MKTGLVLEGGAMRGMFTCGILDIFMENNIVFDGVAWISAGATFGINFKSHQAGRAVRYNKRYAQDRRYGTMESLLKTGDIYDVKFCYHDIPFELDPFDCEAFKADPMEFYVGATDVETGKAVFHKCTDCGEKDLEWIRASASMPGVSRVVNIGKYKLLDGGVSDSIPIKFMEKMGYEKNVIILTQPADYRKGPNKLMPVMNIQLRQYPKLLQAMRTRHIRYNNTLEYIRQKESEGSVFVIQPEMGLHINRTESDPSELERVYQLGREAGKRALSGVAEFIK